MDTKSRTSKSSTALFRKRRGQRWPLPRLSLDRSRSAPSPSSSEVPDLIAVAAATADDTALTPPSSPSSQRSWRPFPPLLLKQKSLPNLEASETSLDERVLVEEKEVGTFHRVSVAQSSASLRTDVIKLVGALLTSAKRVKSWVQDNPLPVPPLVWAAVVGLLVPSTWILYTVMAYLWTKIHKVMAKWVLYFWNDRDAVLFRRTIGQYFQLLQREMELTLQGNYARQVAASFAFYAATAPGESCVAAYFRYKMNSINMRVIEEIDAARDRFYGYQKAPRIYTPFR